MICVKCVQTEVLTSTSSVGTLEEEVTSLKKIVDEMRAGDRPLGALKHGILNNRRKITGK